MLISHEDDHEGWKTYTFCEELKPTDWGPGKPTVYVLRGFAEFSKPHVYPAGFHSKARIDIPKEKLLIFLDFNKGHDYVRKELEKAIDMNKVSP